MNDKNDEKTNQVTKSLSFNGDITFFSLSSRITWKNNEHTDFFFDPQKIYMTYRKSKNNKILQTLNISYFFYYPKKNYFPKVYSIRFLNHHPHYHQHDRQKKNREY